MDGIMVSAATGVMSPLVSKLTNLLGEEYKLPKKVKRDVTSLKDELRSMNAFLERLAQKEDKEVLDPQMKEWRDQVRELAYDTEDLIDEYIHRLQQEPSQVGGIKGFIHKRISKLKKLRARHGISDQIEELKHRITETNERRKRYNIDEVVSVDSGRCVVPIDPRVHVLYEEAQSLVGIDGPRDKLIKLMVDVRDKQTQLKVVSIVGPGGSGKTTLANQVYQNLKGKFQCQAFMSVSRIPDWTKILHGILLQIKKEELRAIKEYKNYLEYTLSESNIPDRVKILQDLLDTDTKKKGCADISSWNEPQFIKEYRKYHGYTQSGSNIPDRIKTLQVLLDIKKKECDEISSWDEPRLTEELREILKDKRYIIVIDDIWDSQAWRNIKCVLPDSNCGSRIMTTTRIINVARSCCFHSHDYVHEISPLSKDDSEGLFFKRIFRSEGVCPPQLKDVSIEIVRRCAGLPLAIITMASLLSNRSDSKEEWMAVQDSIGFGLLRDRSVEEMNLILSLSYVDLPGYLRTCLLYLIVFPEDYVIRRDRLIKRWIAEGFIKSIGGTTLENEGRSCFNELINRSMIQPVDIKDNGKVKACRVHDMILDFLKSKSKEVNFLTLINQIHVQTPPFKVCRLSLNYSNQQCTKISSMDSFLKDKSSTDISKTRSLSIFGEHQHIPPLSNFSVLRVLDIESCLTMDNLMNIGVLLQLRYLRLSSRDIKNLPEEIGQLKFLETLDIKETGIHGLPTQVAQLQKLKHLHVQDVKLPSGIGNMRSLEELSRFLVDGSCSVTVLQELGNLTSLRSLVLFWDMKSSHVHKRIYYDNLFSSLYKICRFNLQVLRFHGNHVSGPHEFTFDSSSLPLEHLQKFIMYPNCYICNIPRWMASLANLTNLKIGINPVEQEALNIIGKLPTLLFLELFSKIIVPKGLKIKKGMFPCLKVFHLFCHDIETGLMFEVGAMPNIERLELPFRAQSTCDAYGQTTFCSYDITIHHLFSLKDLIVRISCKGADEEGVMALELAIRDATSLLPKHPLAIFERYYEKDMIYPNMDLDPAFLYPTYKYAIYDQSHALGFGLGDMETHPSVTPCVDPQNFRFKRELSLTQWLATRFLEL